MLATLAACGSDLKGTYSAVEPRAAMDVVSIEFKSGSKAILKVMGPETEITDSIDGKKLKLEPAQGNPLMTLLDNGDIQFGSNIMDQVILRKKQE